MEFDVDLAVIVGIELVARLAMVDRAEPQKVHDPVADEVEHGDGVRLLQRHECPVAVRTDRDVLGLKAAQHRAPRCQPNALFTRQILEAVEGREVDPPRRDLIEVLERDHRHRSDRVAVEPAIGVELGLVGDEKLLAVGGEGQHVRQIADPDPVDQGAGGGVEERNEAASAHGDGFAEDFDLPVGSGDRGRHDAVLHRDGLHSVEPPQPPEIDRPGAGSGRDIPDVDPFERRVGAVEPAGLMGHDLGSGLADTRVQPISLGNLPEFSARGRCGRRALDHWELEFEGIRKW